MRGPLIVVTGTGTGIGKTHIAASILRGASRRGTPVMGYKPIESGLDGQSASDADRLAAASTFHVQPSPGLRLRAPLSPHLAARLENRHLDWSEVCAFVAGVRERGIGVLVELPGGLFTPLTGDFRNVDALQALRPAVTLLLAPNRLGVLHDLGAALAGAAHVGATVSAVGLVAAETVDESAAHNPEDTKRIVGSRWVDAWPRASELELAYASATQQVVEAWLCSTP